VLGGVSLWLQRPLHCNRDAMHVPAQHVCRPVQGLGCSSHARRAQAASACTQRAGPAEMLPGARAPDGDAGAPVQVARLADRGGARDTWLVLDGAHTRAAAAALAATLRAAFPDAALALVVGMAVDKDAAGVMAALRAARPMAIAFTQAPIAGSMQRCARKRRHSWAVSLPVI